MTFGGPSRAHVEELAFARFPRLAERRHQVAGTLSGGEQQMLAMARTLSVEPAVLLLDEISMGLAPMIVAELYELVAQIAAEGVAVILAEQFAATALRRRHRRRRGRPGPDRGRRHSPTTCPTTWPTPTWAVPPHEPSSVGPCAGTPVARPVRLPGARRLGGLAGAASAAGGRLLRRRPAGADSTLGGFTVSALAEAVTAQYEQPNFPLPATPVARVRRGLRRPPATTSARAAAPPPRASTRARSWPTPARSSALLVPGVPAAPGAGLAHPGHQRVPADAQLELDRPARRQHGRLEHDQRQHGQRHPRRRRADGRFATAPTPTRRRRRARATRWPARPPSSASAAMSATSSSTGPRAPSATGQASATDTGISVLGGLHHHRQRHLDGHRDVGRHHRQGHRVDPGAEHAIAGRAVTVDANGIPPPARARRSRSPSRPLNTILSSSASRSR